MNNIEYRQWRSRLRHPTQMSRLLTRCLRTVKHCSYQLQVGSSQLQVGLNWHGKKKVCRLTLLMSAQIRSSFFYSEHSLTRLPAKRRMAYCTSNVSIGPIRCATTDNAVQRWREMAPTSPRAAVKQLVMSYPLQNGEHLSNYSQCTSG